MGLKSIIEHHVDFQFDVATRKYKTLLAKELDKKRDSGRFDQGM